MKLEEALPALRIGKKIRHKQWKVLKYIFADLSAEEISLTMNLTRFIQQLMDDNWEIVE